jgi:hypothetical protein
MQLNQHVKLNFMPNVKRLQSIEIELYQQRTLFSFEKEIFIEFENLEMFLDNQAKRLIIIQHHFMDLKLHLTLHLVHVHQ